MRFYGPRTGGITPKRFQALGICDSSTKAVGLYTIATKLTPGFPDAASHKTRAKATHSPKQRKATRRKEIETPHRPAK